MYLAANENVSMNIDICNNYSFLNIDKEFYVKV